MTAASLCSSSAGGVAQQPVKIGVVAEFSGPFADYGTQIVNGMKTYLKQNGDTFGGQEDRDHHSATRPGAAPDIAKRLAQELVTRDNVDILAGFGLTPNALAVAPISAEAKKPMVIMNAATSIITTQVAVHRARVAHAAAGHAADRAVGVQERHQARRTRWSPTTARASTPKARSSRRSRRPAARS